MPIGCGDIVPECILSSGFEVKNSLKILGFVIDNKLTNLPTNFDTAIEKIVRIRNFWCRFRLSIAGRINIAKSLMLGQINYFGCVITPTTEQAHTIRTLISGFVAAGINVAQNRIFIDAEQNGLQMIDPDQFLIAQQASWFKKINGLFIDNWRRKLNWVCGGNILTADPQNFAGDRNPLVHNLVVSFSKFRKTFYNNCCNFERAFLLHHPNFLRARGDQQTIGFSFFPENFNPEKISQLRFSDICSGCELKRKAEIEVSLGSEISLLFYLRLNGAVTEFFTKQRTVTNPKYAALENFMALKRRGSKTFREILSSTKIKLANERTVKKFFELCGVGQQPEPIMTKSLSTWNNSFVPNKIRDFSVKFFRNILGVNARVVHFNPNIDESCTFCVLSNIIPPDRETFLHLFYNCNITNHLHERFLSTFFRDLAFNTANERICFIFFGTVPHTGKNNFMFVRIFLLTWLYVIWEAKLFRQPLTPHMAYKNLVFFHQKYACH
jgi:hypothetical protein